jgi:hypothetical protein
MPCSPTKVTDVLEELTALTFWIEEWAKQQTVKKHGWTFTELQGATVP